MADFKKMEITFLFDLFITKIKENENIEEKQNVRIATQEDFDNF